MNTYRVTLRDGDGNVVAEFDQGAANLRLALSVSAARLGGMAAGHGPTAVESTVELVTTCRCGQWPLAEYGPVCPSCAPVEAVL